MKMFFFHAIIQPFLFFPSKAHVLFLSFFSSGTALSKEEYTRTQVMLVDGGNVFSRCFSSSFDYLALPLHRTVVTIM